MGHSMGTSLIGWMLRFTDQKHIKGVALIDPVTMFMYNAALTQEMLFRPVGANARENAYVDHIVFYFVRRELWMQHFFRRYFLWYVLSS